MSSPTPTPQTSNEQRAWLKQLATESYQAELIVSGLAIFGASLVDQYNSVLIDWVLQSLGSEYFIYFYFIVAYLSFGGGIIYVSLIFHFIARTLWIGLVGLHSVFPHGIKFEKMEHVSEDYRNKLKADLPEYETFIVQLDRFCSMIFAWAFGMASIMISLAFVISLNLGITGVITMIFPSLPTQTVANILLFITLAPSFIMALLNIKYFHDKKWVHRFHYPVAKYVSMFYYNINYYPIVFILGIFSSNYTIKRFGMVYVFFIFIIGGIIVANNMRQTNGFELARFDTRFRGERTDRMEPFEYADQLQEGETILAPLIQSDEISGPYLKVFVPLPKQLKNRLDKICGKWEASREDMDRTAKRKERRAARLACVTDQINLQLDQRALPTSEWSFYQHPHDKTEGVITYLSTENWSAGKHILSILEPPLAGEEEIRSQNIVFWMAP